MLKRILQKECQELAKNYPVLTITGPRQSGKTTLAKACFPHKPYANLEQPDQREIALSDPKGFLNQFPDGAILDEIQRTPDLPSYLQAIVDEKKQPGMFILTGSQQLEMTQSVNQSLAGRTALIKLLPFALAEIQPLNRDDSLDDLLLNGFFPRIYDHNLNASKFYMNYFETYIQRDLRQLSQIDNLYSFEKCVHLLATRVGQLLNYSSLGNDLGLSHTTIRKWLSLLEASYVIFLLPPFHRNIGKRIIKTPKIYFYDVGLAAYLLGIHDTAQLKSHPLRGFLFENFVVIEFLKKRFNLGLRSHLFFFRDQSGHEVDLVLTDADRLTGVEIKSSQTFHPDFTKDLFFFQNLFPKETQHLSIISDSDQTFEYKDVECRPWSSLA